MTEGNNGSPYRRSHHHHRAGGGGGHFSPMHMTGASSGGAGSNLFNEESVSDSGLFSSDQNLWDNFETVACSVTDLYRNPSWNVFQRTAAATTQFYKDSVDAYRRGTDAGMTIGRQILCKEILHWLQTSNHAPFVRRDELINFILTRAMMTAPNTSEGGAGSTIPTTTAADFGSSSPMQTQQHQEAPSSTVGHNNEPLEIFQEALAMPPSSRQQQSSANNVGLTAFFVEECRRHGNGKRRRLSPEHHPYYFHSSHNSSDSSPDGNGGSGNGGYWHPRPSKRSRRL